MAGTVFEVRSGPDVGRTIFVPAGSRAVVGRMDWADYAFPGDLYMSETHFELIFGSGTCLVRDLDSSNGTFVNGEQIKEVVVHEGDEIQAGQTTFVARASVETAPAAESFVPAAELSTPSADVMTVPFKPKTRKMSFRTFPCRSALLLAIGQQSSFDPAEIAGRLAVLSPLYVIFNADDEGALPDGVPQEFLGAKPSSAEPSNGSPVLLGPARGEELAQLAAGAWGQDNLVCLFDRRDRAELAEQLREFAHEKWHAETMDLACFRPAAVVEFLANGDPDEVKSLTGGIDAALSEVHQGDRWAVFAPQGFDSSLSRVGLTSAAFTAT